MNRLYSLKWNDHKSHLFDNINFCLLNETLVDVTLACEGLNIKAHKIVLSSCSTYFQSLFLENPCKHPIVILKDVKYSDLKAVIEFMYHGEVDVPPEQLQSVLKIAQCLKVKMLGECLGDTGAIDVKPDQSYCGPIITSSSMPLPEQSIGVVENQVISNESLPLNQIQQSPAPISEQEVNLIPDSEIKQNNSIIEDLNEDDCTVIPSDDSPSPVIVQTYSANSALYTHKSQPEQPIEGHSDAFIANRLEDTVSTTIAKQLIATVDDIQSSVQSIELPNSSLAASTPVSSSTLAANSQQLQNPLDASPAPLQTHSSNLLPESQVEPIVIDLSDGESDEIKVKPKPASKKHKNSKPTSNKQAATADDVAINDNHSSQKSAVETKLELPTTSTDSPHTSTDCSTSYCVKVSAQDVLYIHSKQPQKSPGGLKKLLPKKKKLEESQEQQPNLGEYSNKEKRIKLSEDVKNVVQFSTEGKRSTRSTDKGKKTVRFSDDTKKGDDSASTSGSGKRVVVKIGPNGSLSCAENLFRCNRCSFSSQYSSQLKKHITIKHSNQNQLKSDQHDQVKETHTARNLDCHKVEIRGHVLQFGCSLCSYKCAERSELESHMENMHKDKKPLLCEICGFQTSQKSLLRRHSIDAHKQKMYSTCDLCDYKCTTRAKLRKHISQMHEQNGKEIKTENST